MTELETKTLNALFELCECMETASFEMLAEEAAISVSALRGVVTSLVKKGAVQVRDTCCAHIVIVGGMEWPLDHLSDEEWEALKAETLAA